MVKYFVFPFFSLFFGLVVAGLLSWYESFQISHVIQNLMTVLFLCILEISLSFDNAIVNATVLKRMNKVWVKRFLTWGMLIAVFGMRLIFPLIIVAITANVSLLHSAMMAFLEPDKYSDLLMASHLSVSSFGGAFLFMVFLNFFIDEDKQNHWIKFVERPFQKAALFSKFEVIVALTTLLTIYKFLPPEKATTYFVSYLWGVIVFLIVHGVSELLEGSLFENSKLLSTGLGLFIYLEVLDASFSFDGVIGAFALSHEIIIIMIGLSVGAFFVRGLTLYMVDRNTLGQFIYLEHGAFYALGALAFFMLLDPFFHFPEWLTALSGAAILASSVFWSIKIDRQGRAD